MLTYMRGFRCSGERASPAAVPRSHETDTLTAASARSPALKINLPVSRRELTPACAGLPAEGPVGAPARGARAPPGARSAPPPQRQAPAWGRGCAVWLRCCAGRPRSDGPATARRTAGRQGHAECCGARSPATSAGGAVVLALAWTDGLGRAGAGGRSAAFPAGGKDTGTQASPGRPARRPRLFPPRLARPVNSGSSCARCALIFGCFLLMTRC